MAAEGIEAGIAEALLAFVAGIATDPPLTVAFPGVAFTRSRSPYLAVMMVPNTATLFGTPFDSDVDHQGLLQVSVFWPTGVGALPAMRVASEIVAAFAPGTKIPFGGLQVRIDQQPTVAPAITESDFLQIPVTVRWRCFAPSPAA